MSWKFLALIGFVSIYVALLNGCAKEEADPSSPPPIALELPLERAIVGLLEESVNKLHESKYLETCDRTNKTTALMIARALDQRADEIKAFAKTLPAESDYKKITIGPTTFKTTTAPEKITPGWRLFELPSWASLSELYSKIKNEPVNADWVFLNARTRYLLSNDDNRLGYGNNMGLNKDSGVLIKAILKAIARKDFRLYNLDANFTKKQAAFIHGNAHYAWFLKEVERAGLPRERQKALNKFVDRLSSDYQRYDFRKNSSVTRLSARTFVVPMDPGAFLGAKAEFAKIIESVWRSAERRVKIKWTSAKDSFTIFKIIFDAMPGGRSFVSWGNRSMNIFPDIKTKTIAHEFGHVLGFKDRYFDIWYPTECLYREQVRDDELMSASHRGGIVAENWHELDLAYPLE